MATSRLQGLLWASTYEEAIFRLVSKPTEADFKLGKQSVFQVASLRGVPNRLEVVVVRAEIMADPEDLKAYEGASRDAYCRLSAGKSAY